ncbi:MAG TPA: glycosyltransferase [Elusimicrobiota bacterium]|nr:glycosyltransferase [Elusimicrobiota bacterium]
MSDTGKPLRVLHVISDLSLEGGIEGIVLGILRSYDRKRFHHDVCCITGQEGAAAAEARVLGAEIIFCRKSVDLRGLSSRFRDLISRRKYDIVHSHVNAWTGAFLRGAAEAGVPVRLAHLHSAAPSLTGRKVSWNPAAKLAAAYVDAAGLRLISRQATHILGISEAALDLHWPAWRGEPSRYFIWAGGVDTERFKPRGDAGLERARPPVLIFVGSFAPDKNQIELLDILTEVRRRFPETVLTLVGNGSRVEDVRRRARVLELSDAVRFPGLRSDVQAFLADADVFVSASRREGLPQAVLEAQAAGLPVVASDIAPHREALAPELQEFLYPLGQASAAAGHIERILKSSALNADAGAAARRFILEKFEKRAWLARLQDWYTGWLAQAVKTT